MNPIARALLCGALLALPTAPAAAADAPLSLFPSAAHAWHVDFDGRPPAAVSPATPVFGAVTAERAPAAADHQGSPPPKAYVYSDAYMFRRKVHKYASLATVPLFVAQAIIGQKLYNGTGSSTLRSAHGVLAGATGVLFGLNTVTGAWNLWEGRKDPNGRTKRLVHSVLMLAADAAFLATAGTAPESEHGEGGGNRSLHRSVAIVGFSSASVGYALMLLGR